MSTIVPTDKSTMRLKLLVPMPRIRMLRPASLVFSVKVKPGTSRCRSVICVLLRFASSTPLTTAMEIGTSCRLSARFWAVTITSSSCCACAARGVSARASCEDDQRARENSHMLT